MRKSTWPRLALTCACLCAVWLTGRTVSAAGPLRTQVDALLTRQAAGKAFAAPATDTEFVRRVYLDFTGTIPTAAETRAFLADKAADKRAKLIERLTASPKFAEQLAEAFNIQLMERNGANEEWRKFLTESFRANKPWDQLAREIISPDFKDEQLRGAGWFITRRLDKVGQQDTDYPGLTRDIGRLFLGLDLQCCQCHKHLTVKDYKQVDFNGLFFPIQNLKMQAAGGDYKTAWVQEGLVTNKYEFVSVLSSVKGATGPRVPLGAEIEIPAYATKEEMWAVPPDPKTRKAGVPKFSPLQPCLVPPHGPRPRRAAGRFPCNQPRVPPRAAGRAGQGLRAAQVRPALAHRFHHAIAGLSVRLRADRRQPR